MKNSVSVVIPVYNSASTLNVLVSQICATLQEISFEILLVDDHSNDNSWSIVRKLARENSHVLGIRLATNSGQHAALLAGVRNASSPIIVTADDDLQNPPEEIHKLLDALVPGVDVVYGVSSEVKQNFYRRAGSKLVGKFFASALQFNSAVSMSSFRAFRTSLRKGFDMALGPNVSLDALLTWSTTRFTVVEVKHDERKVGNSNYTFRKLVRFMIDMTTGYSALPLRLASALGFLTIAFGAVLLAYVIGRPILTGERVQGFPMLASTIIIFSGVQIFLLGILGEYIGRMHFRVMNKPTYMVAETTV
jgi:glycosyltransferase involved in cell wall biosynthesis